MRTHASCTPLQLWPDRERAARLVRAETLAAIRFELVERDGLALGWIDLTFADGGDVHVLPGVLADLDRLPASDPGALVWPQTAGMDTEVEAALAERVLAHVNALFRGRAVPLECAIELVRCEAFAAARAGGELGAAPLSAALPRMAPWVYAGRAASGGTAYAAGPDAALGAAVLRSFGITTEIGAGTERTGWYGVESTPLRGAPDVRVDDGDARATASGLHVALQRPPGAEWREIPIARPQPLDIMIAFDAGEECSGSFWIRDRLVVATQRPRRAQMPAARIALVARDDLWTNADADTDHVAAIAEGLRETGTDVHVESYAAAGASVPVDLTVVFGDLTDARFHAAMARGALGGRPYLAVPEPLGPFAAWYEAAPLEISRSGHDDGRLAALASAFDDGTLEVPGIAHDGIGPRDAAAHASEALAGASAILLAPGVNRAGVAGHLGAANVPPVTALPPLPDDEDAFGLPAGVRPFAFAHAACEPRSALLMLAFALRDTDLPLVIATTGGNRPLAAMLRRAAGAHTTVYVDPAPALIAALYRDAALFVDLALRPRGSARLMRAMRAGALPVVLAGSPLSSLLDAGDLIPRATFESVRDTLLRRWSSPLRPVRAGTLMRAYRAMLGESDPIVEFGQLIHKLAPGRGHRNDAGP